MAIQQNRQAFTSLAGTHQRRAHGGRRRGLARSISGSGGQCRLLKPHAERGLVIGADRNVNRALRAHNALTKLGAAAFEKGQMAIGG